MARYDYIIAGAGCAGLSLLVHLIQSGRFQDKKILLVDRSPKAANDHTWCFWETSPGLFEQVVSKAWDQLAVHFPGSSKKLLIAPYRYKMIRADDFYKYCFGLIEQQPNITVRFGAIEGMHSDEHSASINLAGERIEADYIFSSIAPALLKEQSGGHYLLQHFKGRMIETSVPAFDPSTATFMDFRVPQTAGTSFIYMLPLTECKAMIEATVFSKDLLAAADYNAMMDDYLAANLPGLEYTLLEEENGVIPMSTHRYPATDGRIVFIGTEGGKTKASTGYTFKPIQDHAAQLTAGLLKNGHPYMRERKSAARFRFYDRILLHLLSNKILNGDQIFKRLFDRNAPQKIFRFLDNATSIKEELRLTMTLQKPVFLNAAFREIFKKPRF